MDAAYSEWRNNEVKRVGLKTQLEAERIIETNEAQPRVKVYDENGRTQTMRADIAAIQARKGLVTFPKAYSIPSALYAEKYERINWGDAS